MSKTYPFLWRRERDLNPCIHSCITRFRIVRVRPLRHLCNSFYIIYYSRQKCKSFQAVFLSNFIFFANPIFLIHGYVNKKGVTIFFEITPFDCPILIPYNAHPEIFFQCAYNVKSPEIGVRSVNLP